MPNESPGGPGVRLISVASLARIFALETCLENHVVKLYPAGKTPRYGTILGLNG